jgi:hypothetical protein
MNTAKVVQQSRPTKSLNKIVQTSRQQKDVQTSRPTKSSNKVVQKSLPTNRTNNRPKTSSTKVVQKSRQTKSRPTKSSKKITHVHERMRSGLCPDHFISSKSNVKHWCASYLKHLVPIPFENLVHRHIIEHYEMARRSSVALLRGVQPEVLELARQQAETMHDHPEELVSRYPTRQIANPQRNCSHDVHGSKSKLMG